MLEKRLKRFQLDWIGLAGVGSALRAAALADPTNSASKHDEATLIASINGSLDAVATDRAPPHSSQCKGEIADPKCHRRLGDERVSQRLDYTIKHDDAKHCLNHIQSHPCLAGRVRQKTLHFQYPPTSSA